ncbi:MAG: hypothetical protein FD138_2002 [Planctomycetota bacterium]|nr:MAG: hypothetical protein FD138_2002 [Planctomycetota bacterium]
MVVPAEVNVAAPAEVVPADKEADPVVVVRADLLPVAVVVVAGRVVRDKVEGRDSADKVALVAVHSKVGRWVRCRR